MPKKCVLILLDGLGDRSYERFGIRTPLQAANTPCLDELARLGGNGLYHAGQVGLALPSENAHFAMFGYGPKEFPGRGALEALGAGIELGLNDVAVLAHFVHVEPENGGLRLIKDLPVGDGSEAETLFDMFASWERDGIRIRLRQTKGLFGVLVLEGDVAPHFTDSNPMVDGRFLSEILPLEPHAEDLPSIRTACAVKRFIQYVHKALDNHDFNLERNLRGLPPINGLVTQRAGRLRPRQSIAERYGLRALSIADGTVYRGLAAYLGLDFMDVEQGAGPGDDIAARLKLAREVLESYDFIHVHTKAPDQAAHTKSPEAKRDVIEELDRGIAVAVEPLMNDPEVLLVVTADHSTPSLGPLIHSGEPVPVCFVGKGVRRDGVSRFDEVSASAGALSLIREWELMYMILNHLDKAKLRGIMDTPRDQFYWPGDFAPFQLD